MVASECVVPGGTWVALCPEPPPTHPHFPAAAALHYSALLRQNGACAPAPLGSDATKTVGKGGGRTRTASASTASINVRGRPARMPSSPALVPTAGSSPTGRDTQGIVRTLFPATAGSSVRPPLTAGLSSKQRIDLSLTATSGEAEPPGPPTDFTSQQATRPMEAPTGRKRAAQAYVERLLSTSSGWVESPPRSRRRRDRVLQAGKGGGDEAERWAGGERLLPAGRGGDDGGEAELSGRLRTT